SYKNGSETSRYGSGTSRYESARVGARRGRPETLRNRSCALMLVRDRRVGVDVETTEVRIHSDARRVFRAHLLRHDDLQPRIEREPRDHTRPRLLSANFERRLQNPSGARFNPRGAARGNAEIAERASTQQRWPGRFHERDSFNAGRPLGTRIARCELE